MRHKRYFPVLVFFAMLLPAGSLVALLVYFERSADMPVVRGASSPAAAGESFDSSVIDRFMVENLRRTGLPGAVIAVTRGDAILHTAGYGYTSESSPVTPDTPMPIASLSKSFTAAAVMQLSGEGRIRLDAPVREYLFEFELADPRGGQITIRQLLDHSSGLAAQHLPAPPPHRLLAERIAWLRDATLRTGPGAETRYENYNYNVLARLVERVRGESFAATLENRLLRPLGMDTSRSFTTTRDPMPGVSAGHGLVYGVPVPRSLPADLVTGAGGLISSANDLARWLVFQTTGRGTTGEALLSAESRAAMHTASSPGSNYGFGWRQDALGDGTEYVHHSGRFQSYSAHQALFPESGYAYAVVWNSDYPIPLAQRSFIDGLNAMIAMGRPPVLGRPWALRIDNVLGVLTILAMTIGAVGVFRADAWASRLIDRSWWRRGLRLAPYAAVVAGVALVPWLGGVMNRGQSVGWTVWFDVWPPVAIFLVASGLAAAAIVAARSLRLAVRRRP